MFYHNLDNEQWSGTQDQNKAVFPGETTGSHGWKDDQRKSMEDSSSSQAAEASLIQCLTGYSFLYPCKRILSLK